MHPEDKKEFIIFITGATLIAVGLFVATGIASKSPVSSDVTPAASVDTVGVRDNAALEASPDSRNLETGMQNVAFIDTDSGVTQLEDGSAKPGEIPLSPPILAEITAYSEFDSCHYPNCVMANGLPAQEGYAACPRHISLGTMIHIDTLGDFECGDRTAQYLDGRYDVFMGYGQEAYDEAIQFGVKLLTVEIYK